ncbi:Os06g0172101, partial [Oryza sativa Japonica Group]
MRLNSSKLTMPSPSLSTRRIMSRHSATAGRPPCWRRPRDSSTVPSSSAEMRPSLLPSNTSNASLRSLSSSSASYSSSAAAASSSAAARVNVNGRSGGDREVNICGGWKRWCWRRRRRGGSRSRQLPIVRPGGGSRSMG